MKLNKTRLHPSIILENIISFWIASLLFLFAIVLQNMLEIDLKEWWNQYVTIQNVCYCGIAFLIITLIVALISYLFWRKTYIYIDDSFNVNSGSLFKKHVKISLNDIATIVVKKNLIERCFKTGNMKIELNAGLEKTISKKIILKEQDIEKIKHMIFSKEVEEKNKSLVTYTKKDIISHIVCSTNLVSLFISSCIFIFTISLSLEEVKRKGIVVLSLIAFFFVIVTLWKMIKKYFDFHHFQLWKENEKIKISYGLFVHYQYEIPKTKINAVLIEQSLQARIFKKYLLKVINTGIGNEEGEQSIITLYSDEKTIKRIMDQIFPEFIEKETLVKQNKKAIILYMVNKIPLFLLVGIFGFLLSPWYYFIILLLVLCALIQYQTKSIQIGKQFITTINGFFLKTKYIVKMNKITKIEFSETIISKPYQLKHISMNIIGALSGVHLQLGYYGKNIEAEIIQKYH